jgi:hypothetical protein
VSGSTCGLPAKARDTVASDKPVAWAMVWVVTLGVFMGFKPKCKRYHGIFLLGETLCAGF